MSTCIHSVAEVTGAKSVHVLHGLSEDQSWDFSKESAFEDGDESLDPGDRLRDS